MTVPSHLFHGALCGHCHDRQTHTPFGKPESMTLHSNRETILGVVDLLSGAWETRTTVSDDHDFRRFLDQNNTDEKQITVISGLPGNSIAKNEMKPEPFARWASCVSGWTIKFIKQTSKNCRKAQNSDGTISQQASHGRSGHKPCRKDRQSRRQAAHPIVTSSPSSSMAQG